MSLLIAMVLFSLSMSISPGPVNLVTLSTGVNYGFRKAMPFVSGATIGFTALLAIIGFGFSEVSMENGVFLDLLAWGGAAFMCYMGYKIATSEPEIEIGNRENIPGFLEGALLQWLNPKAWAACFAGVSAFSLTNAPTLTATFVAIYFIICYASITLWALAGHQASHLIRKPKHVRILNVLMGVGLIGVAVFLLVR